MAAELQDNDSAPYREPGPSTHLDSNEEVSSHVSEFAQVVFNNVQECYPPASDLQCNYTLTPAIKPRSRDWIGVFKVGWSSTRQYIAFEWAPCPANLDAGQEWTQDITFKAYYLPKEEDAEYYQLCYIDAAGKMRGASTPFQFLEQCPDDFIQIIDDSMDILMIHNKSEYWVEELNRVKEEKEVLGQECNDLREKVHDLEKQLVEAKDHLDQLNKDYENRTTHNNELETELSSVGQQLTEAQGRLAQLAEEAGNYERSLQQTEGAFMEVVNRELALRNKLDDLEKKYGQTCSERDSLKARAEAAEKNNSEVCEEIDNLKELLSHSNQTHQEVRESEVRMKEQYQRMQEQVQQSSADKEELQIMQAKIASVESNRSHLSKELESLKMVQEKLSKDLVMAKTEKESLRVAMQRQEKDFKDEKRKMQLLSHQNKERTTLLQEQISALKDGIQQLAQEKEMVSKGTKGSLEAQQIATKDLKEKMRRAQFQCREEVRRRGEMQKKMISMENSFREEKKELQREVEDLKLRLDMAADEYKKVYSECRQLRSKLEKKEKKTASKEGTVVTPVVKVMEASTRSSTSSVSSSSSSWKDNVKDMGSVTKMDAATFSTSMSESQGIQASAPLASQATQSVSTQQNSQGTQSASAQLTAKGTQSVSQDAPQKTRSRDDTFDLREMRDQMCEMAQELDDRKKEIDRYRKLHQDEKEKSFHMDSIWQLKYQSLERKTDEMQEKYNKLLNDYTNMKHSNESLKFDLDTQQQAAKCSCRGVKSAGSTQPSGSPPRDRSPTRMRNPYAAIAAPPGSIETNSRYGNPYTSSEERLPPGLMEVSVDSLNLDSIRYPPDTVEDAALSDASDAIPPPLELPEPMQPDVLPEGKIVAIKMMSAQIENRGKDGSPLPVDHLDDEREDAQFVDAQEFPVDTPSPTATAPPLSIPTNTPPTTPNQEPELPPSPWSDQAKKCPECVIEFPPTYPEEDFVKHVQRHFAKLCPVCQGLLDPQISQTDFQQHVEECLNKNN